MRISVCFFTLVPTLLTCPLAMAQVSAESLAPEEVPASTAVPGADARERGQTELQAGKHFAAAAEFRQAAGFGDADAMRHLADMAFAGKGVAQNYEQAIHWYCQAALVGNLEAVDRLQAIELGSWSIRRNVQGWEPACKELVTPKPPPRPAQPLSYVTKPDVVIELRVEQEPERDSFSSPIFSPRYAPLYAPWYWQSVNPRHPRRKPERPRVPSYVPGGISR